MEEQLDLDALYLYSDSWGGYRVGKIVKVNDKTVRMENNVKIPKENLDRIYKLSDEEIKSFNGEMVKRLSIHMCKIKEMKDTLVSLKSLLKCNEFIAVDSVKIQEKLDLLNEELEKELPQVIDINNTKYKFKEFSEKLEEVK